MKSIRTLALVTGLLAISGVSQAQFSSTWTAVSDYDFRGYSQSAKGPAIQASADYTVRRNRLLGRSVGVECRLRRRQRRKHGAGSLCELRAKINDIIDLHGGRVRSITIRWAATLSSYPEFYIGANLGNFGIKQWYSDDFYAGSESAAYTEANYTQPIGDKFSLAFHVGYSWGDYWEKVNLRRS